jgi:Holliday junction resolvase RusA-like endonuclease
MAKTRGFECALPVYESDRKAWRREILTCARRAIHERFRTWSNVGPFEVVVLLYLTKGKQYDKQDVDNRLKDVLDGLQGAYSTKAEGKKRAKRRVIKNDASVCRVVVEKQHVPMKYRNRPGETPGGRLIVRGYLKRRWPIRVVS